MKFLVPVDFSEVTNPLLRTVKRLGEAHGAEVLLLHAVPPILYLPYPETFGISVIDIETLEELERQKVEEAKEKLKALEEFLRPLRVESRVEVGDPAEVILEYEETEKPHLLFLGSHKKGLVEKLLVGSTTEKVVKHGSAPDFVVKGSEVYFKGTVVVAHDFSETAQKALEFAVELLKPFPVRFTLLHVNEPLEVPLIEKLKRRFHEELTEEKKRVLSELEERLRSLGLEAESVFLEGKKATEAIAEFVNGREEVELLVVGARGLSGIKRLLLGSTATRLLEKVEKPILIYKVRS